ncbi:divalent-cation tolerance protein CutA [Actinokineospora iranica]|uniref:Divalent cation tolerance protein n=1 Tax=Actinokineospora iranica TaxID=1271860 RepID=A0A1G6M9Q0_9PSEU|nr:divalent-cation tolerance protein CutA [Actinokineospora iranica]SDC52180.1 divalent cation tolerance protein [Actinokineospora iranica]
MATDFYQVVTTTDSAADADALASAIVDSRLGACAHIVGPITSVYRWDGKVVRDQEWRLVVKTAADRLDALIAHIKANHSYDVPMVIATEIVAGSDDYLSWVREETRP